MRIFEEDEVIDNIESNKRLSDHVMSRNNLDGGLGIQFSSDYNLFKKTHGLEANIDQSMDAFTSHAKNITPLSIVFNSILLKSKLDYYNESQAFGYKYKQSKKAL